MFTGIVEELGAVAALEGTRLTVRSEVAAATTAIGDSLAVNGTCLTAIAVTDGTVSFDLSEETLARTALSGLSSGDPVNLERPATLVTRLGGHLVQGHVDGIARVTAVHPDAEGVRVSVRLPRQLLPYVVEKGSLTLDGVSLTVATLSDDVVDVALIPHTLRATTLGSVGPGDPLNVEVDVIAKYVARTVAGTIHLPDEPPGPERQEERSA
jgi:riboflavin synthase